MSPKSLLVIGSIWFATAALWLLWGRTSVSIHWLGKGTAAKVAGTAVIYALIFFYVLFLVGWMVPIGFGIARLISKH
jgi:hypothetical protein